MSHDETKPEIEPLRKSVTVKLTPGDAFDLFTSGIGTWWPLVTHSVSGERAVRCVFEPRAGGRVYEVRDDEETFPWGTVLVWEPPGRVAFTWHPGRGPDTAQEVEVRFLPGGEGTVVQLEHRGWAKLGKEARKTRHEYDGGWEVVLGKHFVQACERAG